MKNSEKEVRFSCPLDCFDVCGLVATVTDNRVVKIRGDEGHPLTRGVCCIKGVKLLERLSHPQRLTMPLKKDGHKWVPLTWPEALDDIAARLTRIIATFGSAAILNYAASGHAGLVKKIDEVFFNYLGGVTVPRGSLCWGAGMAAQRYDFGEARGHHPGDIARAKMIILWGRNPADTNRHLVPYIRQARQAGATIVLIDPRRSASAELADHYLAVRAGTDGALALALAQAIIASGRHDAGFIRQRVLGFERFRQAIRHFTPEWAAGVTGISRAEIASLAQTYAARKPASIIVGYGPQRYRNGGNTVRSIDALGAITGNIGVNGGGVNYANRFFPDCLGGDFRKSQAYARNRRTFSVARLADYLESEKEPPIRCIFVSKANPLVQGPDINRTAAAFAAIDFKVVIDLFMTDTARHADLVLPCTSVLEEEDVVYSGMFSPYVNYCGRAVYPPAGVMGEYDIFSALADRLGLAAYPRHGRRKFLEETIAPLTEACGMTLAGLKQAPFSLPDHAVAWQDGKFATPSGKIELYSEKALADGCSPVATYIEAAAGNPAYPLRLITPHRRDSMHSQHFAFIDDIPEATVTPATLRSFRLTDGARARVSSDRGALLVKVRCDSGAAADAVTIEQGWWHKSGSVNRLTSDRISDMGEQAAFYDCFVSIAAVSEDRP
ncbi:MAG: molybdopterin-dependent oxidoreductase [Deltaproteobacteria bacterium]|nr:molybdopterin-dependent oxidoreductase [Deltaproteobacteria bacterium]